jgi:hypothetical protein
LTFTDLFYCCYLCEHFFVVLSITCILNFDKYQLHLYLGWVVGGWRGRSRFKPNFLDKNSLELALIAWLKCESRETERSMKPVRCVRAAASGANAPDTGSAERGGWVLPAASLAHFFARTLALEKQGLEVMSECSGL